MNKVLWYASVVPLFLVPALALVIANDLFFPFITGKGFGFRMLVEIAFFAWIALMLFDARYRPKFSWILVVFTGFVAWMFIANIFALNPHKAFWSNFERMDGWVTLIHLLMFLIVATSVFTQKLWKWWGITFLSVASCVVFYGLMQIICVGHACGAQGGLFEIRQGGVRVDSTFGNAIYLANYIAFAILLATFFFVRAKDTTARFFLALFVFLAGIVLFYTASRGAILGLFVGAGVGALSLLYFSRHAPFARKARIIGASILACVAIFWGGLFLLKDTALVSQEPTLGRLASVFRAEELQTRFTIWEMAYQGFLERPITGWGQEGFNYVFNFYYNPSLYAQEPWFDRAHNTYLDWLISGGAPAFLIFIAFLCILYVSIWRLRERSVSEKVFLLSVLSAYAFQAFFVFDHLFSYVALIALASYLAFHTQTHDLIKTKKEVKEPIIKNAVVLPLTIIALLGTVWVVNGNNIHAASLLIKAIQPTTAEELSTNLALYKQALALSPFATQEIREQLILSSPGAVSAFNVVRDPNVPMETKIEFFNLATEEMQKEIERAPRDARLYAFLSELLIATGNIEPAREAIRQALLLSPNKQSFLIQYGVTSLQLNDIEGMRSAWIKAFTLYPAFPDAQNLAIASYFFADDTEGLFLFIQEHPELASRVSEVSLWVSEMRAQINK